MARQLEEEICVSAFKSGKKFVAEQLLPRLPQPAVVTTTFELPFYGSVKLVSLLHLAACWGWRDVVTALVSVYGCSANCEDEKGNIPLHYAAYSGYGQVVKYLVKLCDPMYVNKHSGTPLHFACKRGHLKIAQYFISKLGCKPSFENNFGTTPLHFSCHDGHLDIVRYLIREKHCNPSYKNKKNEEPLHYACQNGHLNIVQYLIREEHCNPSCEDIDGNTPLHIACYCNYAHIVQYLLSTGRVNPLTENKDGDTALSYASPYYNIIKLFEPFEECRTDYPVHTYTKLILTGDSGAGKTTTAKHLVDLASSGVPVDCVANVECFTAGIVPHHIQSKQLGNFVVYDFAGQQEYYSSHAAILEQVMRRSAAMFLCLIDLRKSNENIGHSLHYWLSFIDNACSIAEGRSHVLIVGSHADEVASSVEENSSLLQSIIATRRVKRQEFLGCIVMDCRRANTEASCRLISILANSHKAIAASQPVIHYYSHVIYAFLRTKLEVVGCTLHDLVSTITKEKDSPLPNDQSVLIEILTTLSDKGLILFIRHPLSSWVVVKTEALLKEISGTLFAPDHLKEHRDLASNTGIVPVSNLHKVFPDYKSEMLIGFLTSLDFCRPVDPSVLQYTNLQTTPSHSTADLLFFPGLVKSERPDGLVQQGALEFGWCLKCLNLYEFFSSRFLHVLLLSVAYKFPLAQVSSSFVCGLQRTCTVWRNGIFWSNLDNITTVIELLDNNRCLLIAMSCNNTDRISLIEHAKLRSSLIALVHHLQQLYCPCLNVHEFLIPPDLVRQYPKDNLPDTDLFDFHYVAQSMLLHKKGVPSYNGGPGYLTVGEFPFEPYHQLSSSSVRKLLNPTMANEPVLGPLYQEARKLCHQLTESSKVSELREHLDKLSLFVGRNPLEVAGLKEEDLTNVNYKCNLTSADKPCSTSLSIDDLLDVKIALKNLTDWQSLGLALGLVYSTLKKIDEDQRGKTDKCVMEMLAAWLQQQDNVSKKGVPSWWMLRTALRKIDENELADKI